MKAQAKAAQASAAIEAQWAERRHNEETAAGQQAAGEKLREARYAQSKLIAQAGGSGGGASDPTIMDLWKGVEEQGQLNAGREQVSADQRAAGIKFQSDLNVWKADANASIASASAKNTKMGGVIGAIGQMVGGVGSGMSSYYNIKSPNRIQGTGYGSSSWG
jgi:hypothetical protein